MKKVAFLSLVATILLVSCNSDSGFKISKKGLKYKIIAGKGKDSLLKAGDIVQYTLLQKFGDSVARNSVESGNGFAKIDSIDQPFAETEIMKMMRVGDSAMIRISTDSIYAFIKKQAEEQAKMSNQPFDKVRFENEILPFFKKKNSYVSMGIKILKRYTVDSLARADYELEKPKMMAYQEKMQKKAMEEQKKKDDAGFKTSKAAFDKFLGDRVKTMKATTSGAYVEILTEGTGDACAPGKIASVRYKGVVMGSTEEFDSNMPKPGEQPKPTYDVTIGQGGSIVGFGEGIAMLRKGAKAKLYIPSQLGYGGQGSGKIKPYENLIFDIEIEDVKAAPPPPKMPAGGQPQGQQQLTPEQMKQMQKEMQQQQAAGKQ